METAPAVAALAALAQESRLLAFRLLVQAGPDGLPAGTIGGRLGIPAATLSFHLSQLARAGLVRSQRSGRSVVYSADYGAMGELLEYLTENCCRLPAGRRAAQRRQSNGDKGRRRRKGGRGPGRRRT